MYMVFEFGWYSNFWNIYLKIFVKLIIIFIGFI